LKDQMQNKSSRQILQSMTGFSSFRQIADEVAILWEAKSINGKSLDLRIKLPQGYEFLEYEIKRNVSKKIARGTIILTLTIQKTEAANRRVNQEYLVTLIDLCKQYEAEFNIPLVAVTNLLQIAGMTAINGQTAPEMEVDEPLQKAIIECFNTTLDVLIDTRCREGERLVASIRNFLACLQQKVILIRADPARDPAQISEKLKRQIQLIVNAVPSFDEGRLYSEAVIMATKVDVEEELDRLDHHIEAAQALLNGEQPVGRKLDFLVQEFNREINTLCAKSNSISITSAGLEMKAYVDKMREQIQNLE